MYMSVVVHETVNIRLVMNACVVVVFIRNFNNADDVRL